MTDEGGCEHFVLFARRGRGSETYLLEILRQWKRAAVPEEVVLFTQIENHEKLSAEFDGEGWSCVLSPFRAVNRFARIAREQVELPYRVRRAKLDVLWSPGYTAPVLGGCPQVVSLLDMQYKRFPSGFDRTGAVDHPYIGSGERAGSSQTGPDDF